MEATKTNAVKIKKRAQNYTIIHQEYGKYYLKSGNELMVYNTEEMKEVFYYTDSVLEKIKRILNK